jgi:hypothetical protein
MGRGVVGKCNPFTTAKNEKHQLSMKICNILKPFIGDFKWEVI